MHSQQKIVNGTIIPSSNRAPVNTSELCQEDCGQNGQCVEGIQMMKYIVLTLPHVCVCPRPRH
jgi:hypothetical protein